MVPNAKTSQRRKAKDISKGIYIDVGCNHPIKFNNTYLLYKRGWHGINVDTDSTSINLFNKMRKNDHNVNYIVSDKEELKELYFYHERSAINTLSKDLVDSRKTKPREIIKRMYTYKIINANYMDGFIS